MLSSKDHEASGVLVGALYEPGASWASKLPFKIEKAAMTNARAKVELSACGNLYFDLVVCIMLNCCQSETPNDLQDDFSRLLQTGKNKRRLYLGVITLKRLLFCWQNQPLLNGGEAKPIPLESELPNPSNRKATF